MAGSPVVGILALQGCVEPHAKHLQKLGATVVKVRLPQDLDGIQGLVLPGGESTTMLKLAKQFGLWEALQKRSREIPFWGVCAGSILMAKKVENPQQESLGIIDITVRRNAYGRQLDSFTAPVDESFDERAPVGAETVFIRAPKFSEWGKGVRAVAKVRGETCFLAEGRHMVTAFHPELTDNSWCHRFFLEFISKISS